MMKTITIPLLLNGKILWKVFLMILLTQEASVSHNTEPGAGTTFGPRYISAVRDIVTNSPLLVTNAHKKTTPTN